MQVQPKVTVIMPAYGPTTFLAEAIDSVQRQTWPNVEFIVVDDNDRDSPHRAATAAIIADAQAAGQDIVYMQHERNRNGAVARNTGIAAATGEYISFLDSDDFYDPLRLARCVGIMQSASDRIGGVYTGVEFRKGGQVYATHTDVTPGNFLAETLACTFMLGTGSNLFIRRSVVEELDGFDESFLRHQDFECLARLFERYDMAACREVLVTKNNENLNLPSFEKSLAIKEQYLAKFAKLIESLPPSQRAYVLRNNYAWLGELALREGKRAQSSAMYAIAARHGRLSLRAQLRRAAFWVRSWTR